MNKLGSLPNLNEYEDNSYFNTDSERKELLMMKELAETMNIPHELIEKICIIANNHGGYHKIYQLFEQEFDEWENGRYSQE